MSDRYVFTTPDQGLTTTAETILQLEAPSSKRARVYEIGISFDGTSASDAPVDVILVRQTGSGTSTQVTGSSIPKEDPAAPDAAVNARHAFTVEPTSDDSILRRWKVTPNSGLFVVQFPFGREILIAASGRLGLKCTAAANVNGDAYMAWEE